MSEIVKKEGSLVTLKLTVDKDRFEAACQSVYQQNKSRFNIHGFRKGKAPRKLIEMHYGEGVFYEEAIDEVFPETFQAAVQEHQLDVVSRPALDIEEIGKGKDLTLIVDVYVKPEVKLGDYKNLEAHKPSAHVSQEDVEEDLKEKQENGARVVHVDHRPVQMGDKIKLDFLGKVDDVPFDGGQGQNYDLEIGSNSFIPGFEEQLVGMSLAEEKDIKVTFPAQYHAQDLQGKDAIFTVKVHEITEKQLPELDDEFAKDISEFDTLEELKQDIYRKLVEEKEKSAKTTFQNNVVIAAAEQAEVDIPAPMVDNQVEAMIQDIRYNLQYQGLDLETYLQYTASSVEKLKKEMRPEAERRVKIGLTIDAISKAEQIEATPEEIEKEYQAMAAAYNMDVNELKDGREESEMKDPIVFRKVVDFLVALAKEKPEENAEEKSETEA